jgi:hypothetical protein
VNKNIDNHPVQRPPAKNFQVSFSFTAEYAKGAEKKNRRTGFLLPAFAGTKFTPAEAGAGMTFQ